eukprot:TRINITY_DN602_c0_g2_i2.p1 TRINITY_DN602_c0_g2~~TRINITY_DN602_c0_g2_i2.p1  ORF type:complete len:255 (-),score=43.22 TRINITY_DN602_c0_g2_i2:184-948(-)
MGLDNVCPLCDASYESYGTDPYPGKERSTKQCQAGFLGFRADTCKLVSKSCFVVQFKKTVVQATSTDCMRLLIAEVDADLLLGDMHALLLKLVEGSQHNAEDLFRLDDYEITEGVDLAAMFDFRYATSANNCISLLRGILEKLAADDDLILEKTDSVPCAYAAHLSVISFCAVDLPFWREWQEKGKDGGPVGPKTATMRKAIATVDVAKQVPLHALQGREACRQVLGGVPLSKGAHYCATITGECKRRDILLVL